MKQTYLLIVSLAKLHGATGTQMEDCSKVEQQVKHVGGGKS